MGEEINIPADDDAFTKLQELLNDNSDGGVMDIIWGEDIKLKPMVSG